MAVTGKLVVLIVFVVAVIFQAPQMILRPGLLGSLLNNLSDTVFLHRHTHKSFLRAGFSVMETVAVNASQIKLLSQEEAIQVDLDLFNEYKYSVDQLMELAGLSVAVAVAKVYEAKKAEKVLIITGPGNNGGDGMVAARHLKLFGFQNVTLLNARKPTKDLYLNLLHQANLADIEVSYDAKLFGGDSSIGLVIDALFGFSFKPPVRPDFQPLMDILVSSSAKAIPVVSIDIPSGWDVENGPPEDNTIRFMPDVLVSLTAPKACASHFQGLYHFLGGRFVPKKLEEKYKLNLPQYTGTECILRLK